MEASTIHSANLRERLCAFSCMNSEMQEHHSLWMDTGIMLEIAVIEELMQQLQNRRQRSWRPVTE